MQHFLFLLPALLSNRPIASRAAPQGEVARGRRLKSTNVAAVITTLKWNSFFCLSALWEMSAPEKLWRQLFLEQLQRGNPRLTELDFSKGGWWPSYEMMRDLCEAMPLSTSLRSLNFRTVPILSSFACDSLCSSLSGLSLTSLDLGSTGITGAHVAPFGLLLVFKMPALTSLSLARNRLSDSCNDSANVFKNILLSAAHAPQLRHLDLTATGATFPADRNLFQLFLRKLQSLKSPLVLHDNCTFLF